MARKSTRAYGEALSPTGSRPDTRPDRSRVSRVEIEFDEPTVLGALFGQFDQNLVLIENRLGVYISARGNRIQVEGPEDSVARAREVLRGLHERILRGHEVDTGAVEALISMSNEPTLEGIITGDTGAAPPIMIRTRKKTIVPRSATQIEYMRALARDDVIFALGPAGTGKTYLAVAQAVSQLITGCVQRLIRSRPAVDGGERLGFLPGDMKEKVDPYLRPLYDALYDCMPPEQVERRIASGEIEIAPIAFMRGRTLADAFHAFQPLYRIGKPAEGIAAGKVDLLRVAANHHTAVLAKTGQEHLHLGGRGVLRFVKNNKGIGQSASTHEGDGGDFDLT